jgi:hypothetical protein
VQTLKFFYFFSHFFAFYYFKLGSLKLPFLDNINIFSLTILKTFVTPLNAQRKNVRSA